MMFDTAGPFPGRNGAIKTSFPSANDAQHETILNGPQCATVYDTMYLSHCEGIVYGASGPEKTYGTAISISGPHPP